MAHTAAEVFFPDDVMRVLLRALPADARGRACCVCRRWRDILADSELWTELDISPSGGVPRHLATLALLTGAAAHAHGMLASLNLHGCDHLMGDAVRDVLLAAPALRTLMLPDAASMNRWVNGLELRWRPAARHAPDNVLELNNAQQVTLLHLHTLCVHDVDNTIVVLRNEAPLAALRVQRLRLDCRHFPDNAREFSEALNDVEAHPSLTALDISFSYGLPHVLPALVDAVNARQLRALSLYVHRGGVPEVARMLRSSPALRSLCLTGMAAPWGEGNILLAPHLAELGAALLEAPALTGLGLCSINLFVDSAAATTLLGCVSRHPGLRALALDGNVLFGEVPHYLPANDVDGNALDGDAVAHRSAAALTAISALLAEGAPALRCIRLSRCWVDEGAMATLLAALARRPTPLQLLDLRENTRRLAGALLAAAPPNAVHVEVSVDEEQEQDRETGFGHYAMDTTGRLLPAPDIVAGAVESMRFTDAVEALDAMVAAAGSVPNA